MEELYPKDLESLDSAEVFEKKILDLLEENCGKENFRPRLDVVESCAKILLGESFKDKFNPITIGGTNGKGEVALNVSFGLKQNQIKHGLLMSPHVYSVRERISFNGELISGEELFNALHEVFRVCGDLRPSFYESLFLSFLYLAHAKGIKDVVLEVGLGGRYDAVNILEPKITAICSISRDHTEILGETLKEILDEKLGICRKDAPLVHGLQLNYLKDQVNQASSELGFDVIEVPLLSIKEDYRDLNRKIAEEILKIKLSKTIGLFPFISRGRGEIVDNGKQFVTLYGSHNPQGIEVVLNTLKDLGAKYDQILFSFTERPPKDLDHMLRLLKSYPCISEKIYHIDEPHFKKAVFEKSKLDEFNFSSLALKDLEQMAGNFLVIGSYYSLPIIKSHLLNNGSIV